jgi:hypothetical protein
MMRLGGIGGMLPYWGTFLIDENIGELLWVSSGLHWHLHLSTISTISVQTCMLVGLNQVVHTHFRTLLTLFISNVSWVLINIMTESSQCFCKYKRNLGDAFCMMVCVKCRVHLGGVLFLAPTSRNWWSQCVVMPVCYWGWRWLCKWGLS